VCGGGVACAWCVAVARCRWMSWWGVGVDLCVGVLGRRSGRVIIVVSVDGGWKAFGEGYGGWL
jgi:hypothetical protein